MAKKEQPKKTFGFVWYANCCLWCKHIYSVNRVCFGFFGLANRITKEQVIILIKNCAFPEENSSCLFQIRNFWERICSYEHGSKGTKTYLPKPPVYRSWNHWYVLKKIYKIKKTFEGRKLANHNTWVCVARLFLRFSWRWWLFWQTPQELVHFAAND